MWRACPLNVCRIIPQARTAGLAVVGQVSAAATNISCVSLTAARLRRYEALSVESGAAVPAAEISESSVSADGSLRIESETRATSD